jgi:hypothetical protein
MYRGEKFQLGPPNGFLFWGGYDEGVCNPDISHAVKRRKQPKRKKNV